MKNDTHPSRIAHWLLKRATKSHDQFSVLGDYEEEFFERVADDGPTKAKAWYWRAALNSVIPFLLNTWRWRLSMIGNYMKVAFRNIRKHKAYSFINVTGLAIGMACCILLVLYIRAELSIDNYHEQKDRIFRLCVYVNIGDTEHYGSSSNALAAGVLRDEYPEVVDAVRFRRMAPATAMYKDKHFDINRIRYADPSVFNVFTWPVLKGDSSTALESPHSIVISQEVADKIFGDEEPVGRILQLNDGVDYTVTGVMENVPENSHFVVDALCSFSTLYTMGAATEPMLTDWVSFNFWTYILLGEGVDYREFEIKIRDLLVQHAAEDLEAKGAVEELFLQPLKDIYLRPLGQSSGPIFYVYIFSVVALFILLIACVNFMNLSTARSTNRALEVGMRKTLGAHRGRLIQQFLSEAWTLSLISLIIAIALVQIVLPSLRTLTGQDLPFRIFQDPQLVIGLLSLVVLTGFLAGSYPAFFLSAFHPVRVLKGRMGTSTMSNRFRRILVIIQFTISITLIIGTTVIIHQLDYMREKDPGFDKEHLVVLRMLDEQVRSKRLVLKEALRSHGGVVNIAASSSLPPWGCASNDKLPEGFALADMQLMDDINVDEDFIPTMGMEIIAGRNFSMEHASDIQHSVIINETAIQRYGWEEPIGKIIYVTDMREEEGYGSRTVIGVIRDFYIRGLSRTVDPMIINWDPEFPYSFNRYWYLLVRVRPDAVEETLQFLEVKWKELIPDKPFDYFFLDETYDEQFRSIERSRNIFSYFTFLAIFIACLGLLGMASFTAEKRTKEIGIRKVMGATTQGMVALLSRELLLLVLAANILAWPVAYFMLNRWLQGFPYRIPMTIVPFVLSAVLVVVIGFLTIAYQSIKAALANPVDSLRYE
jgi:putative ABC transport system permease protein